MSEETSTYSKTQGKQYLAIPNDTYDTYGKWPTDFNKPAPKKSNVKAWVGLITAIVLLAAVTTIGIVTWSSLGKKDSGVSACEKMAANTGKPAGEKTPVGLQDFQNSKYTDLKVAGVDFVTTVKSQSKDGLGGAMATLTALHTQYAILQTACANHGVTLPPLPS